MTSPQVGEVEKNINERLPEHRLYSLSLPVSAHPDRIEEKGGKENHAEP